MPLSNLIRGNAFQLGFFTGILLFIGLNLYSMSAHWGGIDLWGWPGIPFPFLDGAGSIFSVISWIGLCADIASALSVSFCIGVTTKSVWNGISN